MWRHIHSIWSAYTLGVATSTVSGRFRIILFWGVGCHTAITASEMSFANSTSVALKLSGEYCSITSVPANRGKRSLIHVAPFTATSMICSFVMPKTTRRWAGEVELYK
jgi:predicted naringenin-chalcone synthase